MQLSKALLDVAATVLEQGVHFVKYRLCHTTGNQHPDGHDAQKSIGGNKFLFKFTLSIAKLQIALPKYSTQERPTKPTIDINLVPQKNNLHPLTLRKPLYNHHKIIHMGEFGLFAASVVRRFQRRVSGKYLA
jgi:hypothetical protein